MKNSKRFFIVLIIVILNFSSCRRKSNDNVTGSSSNDTTEKPPPPPGNKNTDSTSSSSADTTSGGGAAQINFKFTFSPEKTILESGNIGMFYKESDWNSVVLRMDIIGGYNVYGITFELDYDTSKLSLKDVREGDFLKKDGQKTNFVFKNQIVTITRVGSQAPGVSGDGNICLIEMEAKTAFDGLPVKFKNQNIENISLVKILPDNKWFGGVVKYN